MPSRKYSRETKQYPISDNCYRSDNPPISSDCYLPVGPFRVWLNHMMEQEGMTMVELSELVQINDRTLRRILGTPDSYKGKKLRPQQRVSIDTVDWALTKADGATQLWHLYPELYEDTVCDIEISA